jgi:hypothetical protein
LVERSGVQNRDRPIADEESVPTARVATITSAITAATARRDWKSRRFDLVNTFGS